MKVLCINTVLPFEKNNYYNVINIHSIFQKDDYITIENNHESVYRFRLNKSLEHIDDYIGKNEFYFYDYFKNIQEERRYKLNKINKS